MVEGSAVHEMVYEPDGKPVDYRILDVNPAFESVIGSRKQEIIGKTSREVYGGDTPPYLDIYARVAETGKPEGVEVYFPPMKKHFAISVYSPGKGRRTEQADNRPAPSPI
jgi:PAS domain-containing protein